MGLICEIAGFCAHFLKKDVAVKYTTQALVKDLVSRVEQKQSACGASVYGASVQHAVTSHIKRY